MKRTVTDSANSAVSGQWVIPEWRHWTWKWGEQLMWVFIKLIASPVNCAASVWEKCSIHSHKNHFKTRLIFSTAGLAALLSLVQQYIPGARLVEESKREAVINLPQAAAKDGSLAVFLSKLDQRLPELGLSSYGLSDSTLEEVSYSHEQLTRQGEILN